MDHGRLERREDAEPRNRTAARDEGAMTLGERLARRRGHRHYRGGSSHRPLVPRPGLLLVAVCTGLILAASHADLFAVPPSGLGQGESRYLYAAHDFSTDANGAVAQDVLTNGINNSVHGYPEDSDNGWILWVDPGGLQGGGGGCGLCGNLAGDGFAVIVRLDWSFTGGGTLPLPSQYPQYASNAADYALATPTVHVWIIGNEPNLSVSWPNGDVITAQEYADAYLMARNAIQAVPGHEDDRVLVATPGPWNLEAGDWRQYFRDVLNVVRGSYDGSAIHAYTHDTCPGSATSPLDVSLLTSAAMGGGWYWHFKVFEHYMDDIPADMRGFPVYITETDANVSWSDARDGWLPAAYTVINDWNLAHTDRIIRALIPYRWEPWDDNAAQCRVFSIRNKPERVNDFEDALALGYRWCDAPGLAPCTTGQCTPGQTEQQPCGNCGTQSRTCDANSQWGSWSGCQGEGPCAAGQTEQQPCGNCGTQSRTCDSTCQWGAWNSCQGPDPGGSCNTGLFGVCAEGVQRCVDGFIECEQTNSSQPEVCGDLLDNDCDGATDDGCPCQAGQTQICGSDVGACQPGIQRCGTDGQWLSECEGMIGPVAETCNGIDDDCNGVTDDPPVCSGQDGGVAQPDGGDTADGGGDPADGGTSMGPNVVGGCGCGTVGGLRGAEATAGGLRLLCGLFLLFSLLLCVLLRKRTPSRLFNTREEGV